MKNIKFLFTLILLFAINGVINAQENKSANTEEPTVFKKPAPVKVNSENVNTNEQVTGTWERTKNPNYKAPEQSNKRENEEPTAERRRAPKN